MGLSDGLFAIWDRDTSATFVCHKSGKHKGAIICGDWLNRGSTPSLALASENGIKLCLAVENAVWDGTDAKLRLGGKKGNHWPCCDLKFSQAEGNFLSALTAGTTGFPPVFVFLVQVKKSRMQLVLHRTINAASTVSGFVVCQMWLPHDTLAIFLSKGSVHQVSFTKTGIELGSECEWQIFDSRLYCAVATDMNHVVAVGDNKVVMLEDFQVIAEMELPARDAEPRSVEYKEDIMVVGWADGYVATYNVDWSTKSG